jgi:methionine-rich copper-binding protein CopC
MMAGLAAGSAHAHAGLTSSTPADGATLSAPPGSVTFTFDADLLPGVNTVAINDDQGNVVASQQVQPTGPAVTIPWPSALGTGTYQVAYRVVSSDGHPVTGAITFTVTHGAAQASTSPSPEPSPRAGDVAPSPSRSGAPPPAQATPPAASNAVPAVIGTAIALVIAAAIVGALATRRRGRP